MYVPVSSSRVRLASRTDAAARYARHDRIGHRCYPVSSLCPPYPCLQRSGDNSNSLRCHHLSRRARHPRPFTRRAFNLTETFHEPRASRARVRSLRLRYRPHFGVLGSFASSSSRIRSRCRPFIKRADYVAVRLAHVRRLACARFGRRSVGFADASVRIVCSAAWFRSCGRTAAATTGRLDFGGRSGHGNERRGLGGGQDGRPGLG